MARFCLNYGVSRTEYLQMTLQERAAWNTAAARILEERKP
jgi:hypothetical protein